MVGVLGSFPRKKKISVVRLCYAHTSMKHNRDFILCSNNHWQESDAPPDISQGAAHEDPGVGKGKVRSQLATRKPSRL